MSGRPLVGTHMNTSHDNDHLDSPMDQPPTYDRYNDRYADKQLHDHDPERNAFDSPYDSSTPYPYPGYSDSTEGRRYEEPWSYTDATPVARPNPTEYNPLFEQPDAMELRPLNPSESKGQPPPPPTGREIDAVLFATGIGRLLVLLHVKQDIPVQEAINRKRSNMLPQKWPIMTYCLIIIMTCLMIWELIVNKQKTGSVIATKPTFNYMIGPSFEVLINIGARFVPCMKLVKSVPPDFALRCMDDTSATSTKTCTVESLCGHGGFPDGVPDQSWRFIAPIFLHVGIVHFLLNMFAQWVICGVVERMIGSVPFLIVYITGGYYGFVLGGNFARVGIPTVGASGAILATEGCMAVDLIMHWRFYDRPMAKALMFLLEFAIVIAMGYIPFAVDGLAHLGGLAMGILLAVLLIPTIKETKREALIVWISRAVAFTLAIVALVLTTKNFYTEDPNAACEWCSFLSCIPTSSNERCKGTGLQTYTTSS